MDEEKKISNLNEAKEAANDVKKDGINLGIGDIILFIIKIVVILGFVYFGIVAIEGAFKKPQIYNDLGYELEIQLYNQRYMQYIGNNKRRITAAQAIEAVANIDNSSNNSDGHVVLVDFYGIDEKDDWNYDGITYDEEKVNKIRILSDMTYDIQIAEYDTFGYIKKIRIIQKSTDDSKNIRNLQFEPATPPVLNFESQTKNEEAEDDTFKIYDYIDFFFGIFLILISGFALMKNLIILSKRMYKTKDLILDTSLTSVMFFVVLLVCLWSSMEFFSDNIVFCVLLVLLGIYMLYVVDTFIMANRNNSLETKVFKKTLRVVNAIFIFLGYFWAYILYYMLSFTNAVDVAKPIIYIYPKQEMNLSISLGTPENITCSYPNYFKNNGWNVKAESNGDLEDLNTGKKLYSLYWEGLNPSLNKDLKEGFVVKGEEVADFLDEKLEILGLNYKEREEFIVYWLPKLEKNKYNFIRFALTEECNEYMPLDINEIKENGMYEDADIDTLIRILMVFKPLNHEIEVKEQILPRQERIGFTVVEWGGSEI